MNPHTEATTLQADQFAAALGDAGVRDVFTLCGNHLLDVYRALIDHGINLHGMRSEGAAMTAADGYARSTKRLGVALVTGGPGHTNAITGLANADSSGSPVLLISGAPPTGRPGCGAHQEIDQVAAVTALCKWAAAAATPGQLVPMLHSAIAAATRAPAGPAHLTVPVNLFAAPASADEPPVDIDADGRQQPVGTARDTAWLGARMTRALRPVAVIGAGAYYEDVEGEIARFGRDHAVPIFTMDCAHGSIGYDNEVGFGYPDRAMNPSAAAVHDADLVLLFGHRVDYRFGFGAAFDPAADIVEINLDHRQLGAVDERTVSVTAPILSVLADLDVALTLKSRRYADWLDSVRGIQAGPWAAYEITGAEAAPFDPAAVAAVIQASITSDVSISLDAGDFVQWCRAIVTPRGPGQWLRAGRMSTCGSGLPLAVGAAVGRQAPVVSIVGDGSLGYHVAELETAARLKLPLLCIVGSNGAWGLELNLQNAKFDPRYGEISRLGTVDYATVAAGFGVEAARVTNLSALAEAVRGFCRAPRPMLLDVPVTTAPSPLTQSIIEAGGV